jgi:hypothetical protein
MIALPAGVRVYLACGVTDMRNYAESLVMRSPRQSPGITAVDQVIALRIFQLRPTTLSIAMSLSGV